MVALVPQPRQMPPPPFDKDDLQRVFAEVIQRHSYQSFGFLPTGRGAQFSNDPEDGVELRPALFQVQARMDRADLLTAPMAADKVNAIFGIAAERLKVAAFLQCAIQIIASADAPDGDAKRFVAEKLLHDPEQVSVLGEGYFGGGVRFRNLVDLVPGAEDNLNIEPDVNDNSLLFIDFQMARVAVDEPISLDQMSGWVSDAFDFVSDPTMRLLSR